MFILLANITRNDALHSATANNTRKIIFSSTEIAMVGGSVGLIRIHRIRIILPGLNLVG